MREDVQVNGNAKRYTVTLEEGETYPALVSTKQEFVGPGVVVFTEHDDGGATLHQDDCTARVRFKPTAR